jgi:GntR family transcriptional regulator
MLLDRGKAARVKGGPATAEIERHSHVPIYEQIAERLRARIQEGELALGDQLPTEEELSAFYGVSRSTLRNALSVLEEQDMVARTSGKGTFVTAVALRQPLHELSSFAESMTEQGFAIAIQPLSWGVALPTAHVREQLRLKDGEQVLQLERLHLVEGAPVGVDRLALPAWVQERVDVQTLVTGSTYHALEAAGISLGKAEQHVAAASASAHLADVLHVHISHPILMVERLAFSAEGQPIEHMLGHYRGDRVMLDMSLVRSLAPVLIAGPRGQV